jgi:PAS domain S-box-containing protein
VPRRVNRAGAGGAPRAGRSHHSPEASALPLDLTQRAGLLLAAFDEAPVGMAIHGPDRRFLAVNRTLAEINGLAVAAHVGRTLAEVIPEMAPVVEDIFDRVYTTGEPVRDVPLTGHTPARPTENRHWVASFLPLQIDATRALAVYVTDTTAQRRLEDALRASEEVFRQIAENIEGVLYLADPEAFHVLYLNPAFERVWALSVEEVRQNPGLWMERIHPDDRARVQAALQADRQHFRAEYRVVRPDGEVRWISDRSFPVVDRDGRLIRIAGMATDETDRRRLEAQLLHAQRMESIGRLAGGIAHDFNNLLTVIMSHAIFASQSPETAAEDLMAIERAAARAADLTRQLLTFARRQVVEPRVIDVNALTLNIDKLLRRLLGADVELVTLLGTELWPVKADPAQLEQVLVNLALNARDAMPAGGKLTIETSNVALDRAYIDTHPEVTPGDYVMIAVSDTGEGIPPDVLPMIFEPFFTTKPSGAGTGLGLATCYGIVRQAGGHIWAYSEPGRGTSFKVYLPRVEGEAAQATTAPAPVAPRGSETILVVEDDPSVRVIAVRTLRALGFSVLEAASGPEALRLAAAHEAPIHLLLTDVVMPHMGGRELAARLRAARPDLKVLFTSGYTHNAIVHRGVLDPGLSFLPKPYVPHVLARRVRDTLDA